LGWNGSGGYTRAENFSADSSAGIRILATRMDTEFNDFASAMTLALTRNGQNSPTANIPMAGFRLVNVGAAASAEDYIRAKEFIRDIPIYAVEHAALTTVVNASVPYYASVSAGQSPPDGARLRVLLGGTKTSVSCDMFLFTPLNTSAGGQAHRAPIWTRGRKFDPNSLRGGQVYDFVYDASASGWNTLNPTPGGAPFQVIGKVIDATGLVAGRDTAGSVAVYFSRNGSLLTVGTGTTFSVSCSISGRYFILSAPGVTSLTSGAATQAVVPVAVKDVASHTWTAKIGLNAPIGVGQIVIDRIWNVDNTTVSANVTIRVGPFTAVFVNNG